MGHFMIFKRGRHGGSRTILTHGNPAQFNADGQLILGLAQVSNVLTQGWVRNNGVDWGTPTKRNQCPLFEIRSDRSLFLRH